MRKHQNPFARVLSEAARAAPKDGRRDLGPHYEIMSREIFATDANQAEFALFATTKPWTAIDVVRYASGSSDCWIRINIYAIVDGSRILVGGGLLKPPSDIAPALPDVVCQVRFAAEQFLVTACSIGDVSSGLTIRFAALATDLATAPDPDAGIWRIGEDGVEGLINPDPIADIFGNDLDAAGIGPDVELCAVEVFNLNAGRRFLHVYDQAQVGGGPAAANLRQVIDVPALGSTYRRFPSSRHAVNRYRSGMIFAASTSAPAYAAAGAADLYLSAWVR